MPVDNKMQLSQRWLHSLVLINSAGLLGIVVTLGSIIYAAGVRANQMDINTAAIVQNKAEIDRMEHNGTDYTRGVMEEVRARLDRIERKLDQIGGPR